MINKEEKNKLEDFEYEQVVIFAMQINPSFAIILTQTIMYCFFFQLKIEDGGDAWERI